MASGGRLRGKRDDGKNGLCLSRKEGEEICIGESIEVHVIKIHKAENRVVLKILAPGMEVDRREVRERKITDRRGREKKAPARDMPDDLRPFSDGLVRPRS